MKVFAILALCLVAVSAGAVQKKIVGGAASINPAGVVNWNRCGGVGTLREVRIAGCEGAVCNVYPGTPCEMEGDLIPSSAAQALTLKVDALLGGSFRVPIMEVELANSSVQPGILYILRFSIVPNDLLSGQTVTIEANISHANNAILEICAQVNVRVN